MMTKFTIKDLANRAVEAVETTIERMISTLCMVTKTRQIMISKIISQEEEERAVDLAITNALMISNIMAMNSSSTTMIITTIKSKAEQVVARKITPVRINIIKMKVKRITKIRVRSLIESVKLLKPKGAKDQKLLELMLDVMTRRLLELFLVPKLANSNNNFNSN